jgi:hypothetical protein
MQPFLRALLDYFDYINNASECKILSPFFYLSTQISGKYDALKREMDEREEREASSDIPADRMLRTGGPDDIDNVRLNEGRGRFFVEAKNVPGGALLLLKGKRSFIIISIY